jgi:glyoxylase-like metal-dependent hydrolase (beta-lactamase superfamily II)
MADRIVQIRETWIDPYLTGDMWLVRGRDLSLLIDTGTGIVSPRAAVDALAGGPLLALATNGWYDHAGGLHAFAQRACHAAEADIIATPTAASSVADVYVSDDMLRALPAAGYEISSYRMHGTSVTRVLADGEVIDLGDRRIEVLGMPGDTPGHVVLFEAATGTLFTGDTLFDDPQPQTRGHYRSPGPPPDDRSRRQRNRNLERLAALRVKTVCGGHFGQFGVDRLRLLIEQAAER